MGDPSFSKALYDCALECSLRRRQKTCKNTFGCRTCSRCRLYVGNYVDTEPRQLSLYMLQAEMNADAIAQPMIPRSFIAFILIILTILGSIIYVQHQRTEKNYQQVMSTINK